MWAEKRVINSSKLETKNSATFSELGEGLNREVKEELLSISVSLSVYCSPVSVNGEFPFKIGRASCRERVLMSV